MATSSSVRSKRTEQRRAAAEAAMTNTNSSQRTIDLIGEEAYNAMTERIDKILREHSHEPCVTLSLTCGPDTEEGAKELHSILPGTPIQLTLCNEGGVDTVDVYNNGLRIGRFALLEAMTIYEIMKNNVLRAAFVAEQNCYGIQDSLQLAIIVFYEPKTKTKPSLTQLFSHKKQKTASNSGSIEICEN